jgi:hypothetical protein
MRNKNAANKPQKKQPAMITLAPELKNQVEAIAAERQWSFAQTGGWLVRLGLQVLSEDKPNQPQSMVATA